jgi:integrase
MTKITNELYRQFLDKGIMQYIDESHINEAIKNITGKNKEESKALIITAYYTGARPGEYLQLTGKDAKKEGNYLILQLKGTKGGLPRPIYLSMSLPLIKQLYTYITKNPPEAYLFPHYKTTYKRKVQRKKGEKTQIVHSDKLRYYFKKWFKNIPPEGIPPYYLRHNRFSKVSQAGATLEEMRQLKGSKTIESVMPYLHMSTSTSKKNAKRIR